MQLSVLALDYDGTIAQDGVLDPEVRQAILEIRAHGVTVVMVTGRILDDLRQIMGDLRLVDAVVAENGAVIAFPASGRSVVLAPPVSDRMLMELRQRGIEARAGACVIETAADQAGDVLDAVRTLELPLVLLFNRGRLMVLPQAVSKATGLREALSVLRLSTHNAIGIGDAENDHELLAVCEVGVAVAWGSAALIEAADAVIDGTGPWAVAAYLRRVARDRRLPTVHGHRRRLLLGVDTDDGQRIELAVTGRNVLVAGDPRSGKSWVTGLLCEQLMLARYCVCVIDPEGDYRTLEALPGVRIFGGLSTPPSPAEVVHALRYPDVSVLVDLSAVSHADKVDYLDAVLPALRTWHRRTGLPHGIVVDEAHYFLHGPRVEEMVDLDMGGYILVTYRASSLEPSVRRAAEAIVVTRTTDEREAIALAQMCGAGEAGDWQRRLATLTIGEAALLPTVEEASGRLRRVRLAARLTSHIRHRQKYLDVPVPAHLAFYFPGIGGAGGRHAQTLTEFVALVVQAPREALDAHLRHHDFSRWIGDVYGDHTLAAEIHRLEDAYEQGRRHDINDALVQIIRDRYEGFTTEDAQ
jgi:hydroxymethylpyrimidine pyrophosphatase-like HAD family hydrolase